MSINLGDITATTLRHRNKELADNITNHNAFFAALEKKGHIKDCPGGRTLVEPLMYAENQNAKFYDGYETFTVTSTDMIDAAEYDWKQLGGFATISGIEEIKNAGKYAALNMVQSRIKVLEATLKNAAATSVYSDGTGTSGKEFGGLQLLVADDPTAVGTVGGIAQNTEAFWRNQANDVSGGATSTDSSNIKGYMNSMWLSCVRGTDKPDLILTDSELYTHYEESLQQYQRFASADSAAAGFESLKYKSADVIFDDQAPTRHMYFLNTDYLYMQAAKDRKFSVGKAREIQNADYTIIPIWLAGNLTCSNRSLQGVFVGRA